MGWLQMGMFLINGELYICAKKTAQELIDAAPLFISQKVEEIPELLILSPLTPTKTKVSNFGRYSNLLNR